MSKRQQLASTVTGGTVTADAGAPVRPQRFTASDSPQATAKQLNQLSATVTEAQRGATSRNSASLVVPDLAVIAGGDLIAIAHGLGRRARWRVVDWTPTVDGTAYNITRSAVDNAQQTSNTLYLRSYAAGTISIEVF